MTPWKVLTQRYLVKDKWLTVRADECVNGRGVTISPFYVLEYPEWVSCFVVDAEGIVLMVDTYRHGAGKVLRELVGGMVDPGEAPEETAIREVREELGYEGGNIQPLKSVYANPAMQYNRVHSFLLRGGTIACPQQLDATEDINVVKLTLDEARAMRDSPGYDMQAYHMLCLYAAFDVLDSRR